MAFLTGWNYRKKITITGQTGAGTNYQVLLKVGESSGATGYDFHVEGHSASFPSAKNVGGDLRLTSSDGTTLLDFWVESVSGSAGNRTALIWVEVAADLGSNQNIYCYYGNSGASDVSNGDNTFILFDDFNGAVDSAPDSGKWGVNYTVTQRGDSTVRIGGRSGKYNGIYSLSSFGENHSVLSRAYVYNTTIGSSSSGCFVSGTTPEFNGATVGYYKYWAYPNNAFYYEGASYVVCSQFTGSYYIFETKRNGSGAGELIVDRTSAATISSGGVSTAYPVGAAAYASEYVYMDWVAVKKCIATEPSFNTAGSEEVPVKLISAKSRVKQANLVKTTQAKGRIKQVNIIKAVTAKSSIKQTKTKTAQAKAMINSGKTKEIQAKANIKNFVSKFTQVKGRVKRISTPKKRYACDLLTTGWRRCADDSGTDVGGTYGVGRSLKAVGVGSGVGAGNDLVGFAAKLPGYRHINGSFYSLGSAQFLWLSTPSGGSYAWYRYLATAHSTVARYSNSRDYGFSVRCLRDTDDTSDFTDPRDGNVYPCVKIGTQVWMKKNLAYLPSVNAVADASTADPKYYVYGYDGTDVATAKATDNYSNYGVLYNYPAALISCPDGFHLPSDEELNILEVFVFNLTQNFAYGGATIYAKERIKNININNDIKARSRIKNTVLKSIQTKSSIKQLGIDQEALAKGRIKVEDNLASITSKARVKKPGLYDTIQAKSTIKHIGVGKEITAKGRVKDIDINRSITAKGSIKRSNIIKSVTAKGRIKRSGVTRNLTAKARIWGFPAGYVTMNRTQPKTLSRQDYPKTLNDHRKI